MQSRSNIRLIIAAAVLIVVGLAAYLLLVGDRVLWIETYKPDDKNPYGSYVFFQLMNKINGGESFYRVNDTLSSEMPEDPTPDVDNYLFLGNQAYHDSADTEQLLHFVAAGNRAFFLVDDLSNRFLDSTLCGFYNEEMKLYWIQAELKQREDSLATSAAESETPDTEPEYDWTEEDEDYYAFEQENDVYEYPLFEMMFDSSAYLTLRGRPEYYPLRRVLEYETTMGQWTFLQDTIYSIDGNTSEILGNINEDHPVFIRIRYGKGDIYLHTTPLIFTNYFMVSDTANAYVSAVVSRMGSGKTFWDEENRDYDWKAFNQNTEEWMNDEGPLEFILSERSLRNAWYLLLFSGILYLIFGARREQRIIPVRENMDNTSIEYAEVISQLFMKQSDHKKLILLKMDLFKSHLRERFMLRLPQRTGDEDDMFFRQAAQKTGADIELIREIFQRYAYLSLIEGVDTPDMLHFHNLIEQFYTQTK